MKRCLLLVMISLLLGSLSGVEARTIVLDPPVAWQGKTVKINVLSDGNIAGIEGAFLGQKFDFYAKGPARNATHSVAGGDDFRGIVGVPIDQKPGHYDLELIITHKNGKVEHLTRDVKVWATKFPFSSYWLKPQKKKLLAPKLVNRDWAHIEKTLVVEDPQQLWSGKFVEPVADSVSQGFGHRQIVNGKRSGNHRGVDFASLINTEVRAPNRGRVVFRKYLDVFGGTLVIDHGQGIHTLYFHLAKCYPEVGQMVEKGEVIALTGHSGVSSGPHLHWGMSVHNLRVDPLQWTKNEI